MVCWEGRGNLQHEAESETQDDREEQEKNLVETI